MPTNSPKSARDRAEGSNTSTHPRPNGDLILEPEDIQEGQGDFVTLDEDTGDPEGYPVGRVETPDGQNFYIGPTPDTTTRQNGSPVPPERDSFQASQPTVDGPPPPLAGSPFLAPLPRPPKPIIKKVLAAQIGYPGTTAQSPLWYAYAYSDGVRQTLISPPVSFQVANGQGFRAPLPEDVPDGIHYIALYVSEPGTSTAVNPGPMREQRLLDLRSHRVGYYDFTGPYRMGRLAPTANETSLPNAPAPTTSIVSGPDLVGGTYNIYITWVNSRGETKAQNSANRVISAFQHGRHLRVNRPPIPDSATGWYAYVNKVETPGQGGNSAEGRIYFRDTREGGVYPLSRSRTYIDTGGDTAVAQDPRDKTDIGEGSPPTENTTAVDNPDSAPEAPVAFGASYPEPGPISARVTNTLGTRETLPSEAASAVMGTGEIARIVSVKPTNALANPTFNEVSSDGLPLDFTFTSGVGVWDADGGNLLFDTAGSQTAATKNAVADPASVVTSKAWHAWTRFTVENPTTGTYAGSVEFVLRQVTSTGTTTDTVLFTATTPGEYEPSVTINPVGGTSPAWASTTSKAGLIIRPAGATKNFKIRVKWLVLKDHTHSWRPEAPDVIQPSGAITTIGLPPDTVSPAAVVSIPEPDRPRATGTVEESITYNTGLPGGWTTTASGGATLTVSAAAALTGAQGLRLQKTTGGALSAANQKKTRSARANDGLLARFKPAVLPAGKLVMNGLGRPSDGTIFAWLETGSQAEISKLVITAPPTDPGSVSVEPQGALQNVAVVATKEVATLAITGNPTTSGTITATLGGVAHNFSVGGTVQVESLTVGKPSFDGYVTITLNGVQQNVNVRKGDGQSATAQRIRNTAFPGWKTGGSSNIVTFESLTVGVKTAPAFNSGTSATLGTITTIVAGSTETASQLAARIRSTAFTDWIVTGSGTSAIFTAVVAGPKTDASVNFGTSGATGTMTTNTQGAVDTTADLAARIRGTTFTGWTLSGTGSEVIFTATTAGVRTNLRFNPNATGVRGTVTLLSEGKNADLSVHLLDESGTEHRRRIMDSLGTTTIYNVDLTVTGAGTEHASVTVWGSTGSATKTVLADWTDIDLSSYPAGHLVKGVISESSAASTWDLHMDDVKITNGGETYFERHNALGEKINQIHHYGPPTQPLRQDLLIGNGREVREDVVLPNKAYVYGAKLRYKNITTEASPLYVVAHRADGTVDELGDVSSGILGTASWAEYTLPFTTPPHCTLVSLRSKDIGEGEIVLQQIVLSPGVTPKRTYKYATSGVYRAFFDTATPNQPNFTFFSKIRQALTTDYEAPTGTTVTVRYRSSKTDSGLSSATWFTDPTLVPDLRFLEIEITLTGNSFTTPVVITDSPRVEDSIVLGGKPEATLLKEDASEFDGGAIFGKLQEWANVPEVGMQVLPGRRLRPHILSEAVGQLLESELHVFSQETRIALEESWYEPKVIEAFGSRAKVRFSSEYKFERKSPLIYLNGKSYAWYTAKLPGGEVLEEM